MMNEHIKKLVIEAAFDEGTMTPSSKIYTFTEEKMSKFAELIVRECAGIVEYSPIPNVYGEPGLDDIADKILEHFGVEA